MAKTMVHTHVHSDFSILDGCQRVIEIATRVRELEQPAVALTDHGVIGNMLAFEKACKDKDIKHIHGIEVYVTEDMLEKSENRYHTVLLAKNNEGLSNLIKISSKGFIDGFYYRPRIDVKLLKEHKEGLVVSTACTSGLIPRFITGGEWERAVKACKWFLDNFGEDFYLELMPNVGRKDKEGQREQREQTKVNDGLLKLSKELSIPLIATNDAHYSTKEGHKTHEVLLCISSRKTFDAPDRWRPDIVESYIKSREEMEQTFYKHYPSIPKTVVKQALDNTLEIANKCETWIEKHTCIIPPVKDKSGNDVDQLEFLKKLTKKGWKRKLLESGHLDRVAEKKGLARKEMLEEYKERVNRELRAIDEQDYASYFLVVWDLYNWVREQDIFCGPGRGSSAGSLVCYLLDITQVDPIEYDLLFERFLRPGRVTAPDIDMDFQDDRRDEIKQYLIDKWGKDCVSNIGNYGTEKGKAALKDVGRVFGIPWQETQKVTELVIQRSSGDARASNTIEDTFKEFDIARRYNNDHPEVLKHAKVIEGRIRQKGVHASGVVVAPFPLTNMIPLERHGGRETGIITTGLDWRECDEMGLLKLDLLGLSTLTVIKQTLDLIKERTGEKINMYGIPADDSEVMKKFASGDCIGAFQFDSIGMSKMCTEAPMENLNDIAVVNALYRPGGMRSGLAGRYLARKAGKQKRKSVHPIYDRITEVTEGCIVYQEQVMALFAEMGQWNGIEVDSGRKMIAKSHGVEELNRQRNHFVNGALSNPEYMDGLTDEQRKEPEGVADSIYTTILHFGSYGFNKCVSGDTLVEKRSGNQFESKQVSISTLYERMNGQNSPVKTKYQRQGYPKILSLYPDGSVRPQGIKHIYYNGKKIVWEIIVASGEKIRVTGDHRLLTDKGWKRIYDIKLGVNLMIQREHTYELKGNQCNRAKGKKYYNENGPGHLDGKDNISYIDGRSIDLEKVKQIKESISVCENCGDELVGRFEFHHANGDRLNNTIENVVKVCNSCHKKLDYNLGLRKVRWSKGKRVEPVSIVSIVDVGEEETYDIEMEQYHNYIANGFVSHNSHAVAYGLISYWTMYLKTYYPLEFYSVLISRESEDDNISRFIRAMRKEGVNLLPPDINKSSTDFSIEGNDIRAGLGKIKNVGEGAIKIIEENRPYKDIDDFLGKVVKRIVNKKVVNNLIKAGAFDLLHPNRGKLLAQFAEGYGKAGKIKDIDIEVEELDEEGLVKMAIDVLPIPPAKHILDYYSEIVDKVNVKLTKVDEIDKSGIVYMAGTITDIKYNRVGDFDLRDRTEEEKAKEKNWGRRYANINLEDETGFRRHKFSPELYDRYQHIIEKGNGTPVIIKSKADIARDINYVIDVADLDDTRQRVRNGEDLTEFETFILNPPWLEYQDIIDDIGFDKIGSLDKQKVKVAGAIASVKEHMAKNGLMAFAALEDDTGSIELLIWADAYAEFGRILKPNNLVAIKAVSADGGKYAVDIRKGCKVVTLAALKRKATS